MFWHCLHLSPLGNTVLCIIAMFSWKVLIKQEIQRKSGYAIQVDEEHLRVQLDTIQSELNAPTQFKASLCKLEQEATLTEGFGLEVDKMGLNL